MESGCSPETCHSVSGELVVGSSPPQYWGSWDVTRAKGRWSIKVESPHRSNTVNFKVNKRGQIVEVAQSWVGAEQNVGHGGEICDDIVRYVYGYVGLGVEQAGTTTELYNASLQSSGQGGMVFYRNLDSPTWQHVGIDIGGDIVDQNCGCPHSMTDPPTVGSHAVDHPDLQRTNQNPPHYDQPPVHRDLQELVTLDGE